MQGDNERDTITPRNWTRRKVILIAIFVVGVAVFLWGGRSNGSYSGTRNDGTYGDFMTVYGSARCIVSGCNPYRLSDVQTEIFSHGVKPSDFSSNFWENHSLLYPPLTYYFFAPFAFINFLAAGLLYFWLSATALIFACVLTISFSPPAARTVVVIGVSAVLITGSFLLRLGQPSTIVIALLITGSMLFLSRRHLWLAALLIFFAAAIKPQLVLPVLVYFCLPRETRKYALSSLAAFVLASLLAGVTLSAQPASAHWLSDLTTEVHSAVHSGPDARVDTGIVDLKGLVSLTSANPYFYQTVDFALFAAFLIILGIGFFRAENTWERDWICIAALTFFTLLLTYHRGYDLRLQILSFPALGILFRRSIKLAAVIAVLNCFLLFSTSYFLLNLLISYYGISIEHNLFVRIFVERQQALFVFFAAFLWAIATVCIKWQKNQNPDPGIVKG